MQRSFFAEDFLPKSTGWSSPRRNIRNIRADLTDLTAGPEVKTGPTVESSVFVNKMYQRPYDAVVDVVLPCHRGEVSTAVIRTASR